MFKISLYILALFGWAVVVTAVLLLTLPVVGSTLAYLMLMMVI